MRKSLVSILVSKCVATMLAMSLVHSAVAGDRIVLRRPVFTGPVVAGPAWPGYPVYASPYYAAPYYASPYFAAPAYVAPVAPVVYGSPMYPVSTVTVSTVPVLSTYYHAPIQPVVVAPAPAPIVVGPAPIHYSARTLRHFRPYRRMDVEYERDGDIEIHYR